MPLRIAKNLSLPDDAATQTYGFIARKGAGKTYAAGKLVEELLTLGAPTIVIDPVGNWYGLQIAADGRSPGFAIPVFGGEHGDVPIAVDQGDALARLLVPRRLAAVVDVSSFRKNERKRFVAEFAEALFHAAKLDPTPRTIVIEEAQVFAPQRERGSERLLGAIEDIVRLGRNYGWAPC
jgi:DNA helicase HerA-like ATPase